MGSITLHNKISGFSCNQVPESNPKSDRFSELWVIALYNQVCDRTKE